MMAIPGRPVIVTVWQDAAGRDSTQVYPLADPTGLDEAGALELLGRLAAMSGARLISASAVFPVRFTPGGHPAQGSDVRMVGQIECRAGSGDLEMIVIPAPNFHHDASDGTPSTLDHASWEALAVATSAVLGDGDGTAYDQVRFARTARASTDDSGTTI